MYQSPQKPMERAVFSKEDYNLKYFRIWKSPIFSMVVLTAALI